MGFRQTEKHVSGKRSHHPIALVRGQYGDYAMTKWLQFLQTGKAGLDHEAMEAAQGAGFDCYEAAGWELDLSRCDTDAGAEILASEMVAEAQQFGLMITTVAAHLQGQALGDESSVKTLQFVGGQAAEMYCDWRKAKAVG